MHVLPSFHQFNLWEIALKHIRLVVHDFTVLDWLVIQLRRREGGREGERQRGREKGGRKREREKGGERGKGSRRENCCQMCSMGTSCVVLVFLCAALSQQVYIIHVTGRIYIRESICTERLTLV